MPKKLLIFIVMKVKEIRYSSKYIKSLKKYSTQQKLIAKKVDIFINNPFEESLKTHKLFGQLSGYWSFSVSYHLRVMFFFAKEDIVGFIDIGTHEIYK